MISFTRAAALLAIALTTSACNWFDSDRSEAIDLAPDVATVFPSRSGITPAESLTIRGTASDDGRIANLTVNGVAASSDDAFQNWSVEIALEPGENLVVVEATDNAGNRTSMTPDLTITRRNEILRPFSYETDHDSNTLYFVDLDLNKIMSINLATGNVAEVSDLGQFQPQDSLGRPPIDLALDLSNNRIFLTVRNDNAVGSASIGIWALDTVAGTWAPFSDAEIDTAAVLQNPSDIYLDASSNRLLVIDVDLDAVVAVDLGNGSQSVLSSNTVPDANVNILDEPLDAVLDVAANRMLLVDRVADAVLSIDLTSGTRTIVSGQGVGSGPVLDQPLSIELDAANNRVFVFDRAGSRGVFEIDIATGERRVFAASFDDPNGLFLRDVRALSIVDGELIALDNVYDHAIAFDLTTAERRIVTNNGFPRGANTVALYSLHAIGEHHYGQTYSAIGRIGTDNSVEILAGSLTGASNALDLDQTTFSPDGSVAYATGATLENGQFAYFVQAIDLADGSTSVLSDNTTPDSVNALTSSRGLLVDASGDLLYSLEQDRIVEIDTSSGARTILPDDGGIPFVAPRSVTFDQPGNRLLIADSGYGHLISVDPVTGARNIVANIPVEGDSNVESAASIAIVGESSIWLLDDLDRLLHVDRESEARDLIVDIDALGPSYPKDWYELYESGGLLYAKAYSGIVEIDPQTGEILKIYATPASAPGNAT